MARTYKNPFAKIEEQQRSRYESIMKKQEQAPPAPSVPKYATPVTDLWEGGDFSNPINRAPLELPRIKGIEGGIQQGRLNPDFAKKYPTITKGIVGLGDLISPIFESPWISRAGQAGGEIMTLTDNPNKVSTGSGFKDTTADLWGNLMGFVANPTPSAAGNVGAGLWKGIEKGVGKAAPKVVPKFEKMPSVLQTGVTVGATAVPWEAAYAYSNERPMDAREVATVAAINMGLGMAGRGLANRASRKGLQSEVKTPDSNINDDLMGFIDPEFRVNEQLSLPEAQRQLALPEPRKTDFTITPEGVAYEGLLRTGTRWRPATASFPEPPKGQMALPRGAIRALHSGQNFEFGTGFPQEGMWFVDPYGVARQEPGMPKALSKGKDTSKTFYSRQMGDDVHVSRSDIGDAQYLKQLEKRYNEIIRDRVKHLKNELLGVEWATGQRYDSHYDKFSYRVSLNPKWYQDFWKEYGRAPREGEWRERAINTLLKGNEHTGEPFNEEFVQILSELSRQQKLPQEWHDLTRTAMEFKRTDSTGELGELIDDALMVRSKVEPYGLERDIGVLDNLEQGIRDGSRMKDSMTYAALSDIKFKYADSTAQKAVSEANRTFEIPKTSKDRINYNSEGWSAEMELADKVAQELSGTSVIPVKMPSFMEGVQGFFDSGNKKIFVNSKASDPISYVTLHEATHRMEITHPEHYAKIRDIAVNNLKEEHSGLIKRYRDKGYSYDEMPDEFTSDLIAEMLHDKSFIGKLRENAPEVIQPLLKVLDDLINKVKLILGRDESVLPYIRNLENLRNELAPEYASYLETVQGERMSAAKYREGWGKAAKVKGEAVPEVADNIDTPEFRNWFGDSKVVDERGRPLVVYHNTSADFNAFDVSKARQSQDIPGIFFSDSPTDWADMGDRQIQAYLSIKNPYTGNYTTYKGIRGGSTDTAFREIRDALIKDGYDGIITRDGDTTEYIAFFPEQIKSIYNRGTFDPTNPDIRFKLGEGGKSPVDELTKMVQFGSRQLHKGNYEHFGNLLKKEFPEALDGYTPEMEDRLINNIWNRAKELRDGGETTIKMGEREITIGRGETPTETISSGEAMASKEAKVTNARDKIVEEAMAEELSPSVETMTNNSARINELVKEINTINFRISGTRKSTTKYATKEAKDAHVKELQEMRKGLNEELKALKHENNLLSRDIANSPKSSQDVLRLVQKGEFGFTKADNELIAKLALEGVDVAGLKGVSRIQAQIYDITKLMYEVFTGGSRKLYDGVPNKTKEFILDGLDVSKGNMARFEIKMMESLKKNITDKGIGKNTKEARDLMDFGEGKISESELKARQPMKWQNIKEADKWFRQQYDDMIEQANAVITEIYGHDQQALMEKLIRKRQNYYTHIEEIGNSFNELRSIFSMSAEYAPIDGNKNPLMKGQQFMKERKGEEHTTDAVEGFLNYIRQMSYHIHITPHIGRLKAFSEELAKQAGDNKDLSVFIDTLKQYEGILAGTNRHAFDDAVAGVIGNTAWNSTNKVLNRVRANMIGGSPATLVAQLTHFPMTIGKGKGHSVMGLFNAVKSMSGKWDADPMLRSHYMTDRYKESYYRSFETKWRKKGVEQVWNLLENMDKLGGRFAWHTMYQKALALGKFGDEAIMFADQAARGITAGRSIMDRPLVQQAKMVQMFTPFQLEINNISILWWEALQGVIKDRKPSEFISLAIASYAFNELSERTRGNRIMLDPIHAVAQAVQYLIDDELNIADKAKKSTGRMAGEVLSNVMGGSIIAQWLPFLTDERSRREFLGSADPTRYGTGTPIQSAFESPSNLAFLAVPPAGGLQAQRMVRSIQPIVREGVYDKNDNLMFPVERNPYNVGKQLTFGKWSTKEARDYFGEDRRPLSEKETAEYERRVAQGEDPYAVYEHIYRKKEIKSLQNHIKKTRERDDIGESQKNRIIQKTQAELSELRGAR